MTVAAFVISVLALPVAFAAAWYARKQALAMDRQTALLEAQAAKYGAPWELRRVEGWLFELVNQSAEPALDVEIELPVGTPARGKIRHSVITAGSSVALSVPRAWGLSRTIVVIWSRPDDEGPRHSWQALLP